jgi:predicted amino acid dehydrogenase
MKLASWFVFLTKMSKRFIWRRMIPCLSLSAVLGLPQASAATCGFGNKIRKVQVRTLSASRNMNLLIVSREQVNDQRYGLGQVMRRISEELVARNYHVTYCSAVNWRASGQVQFEHNKQRLKKYSLCWVSTVRLNRLGPSA